MMEPIVWPRLNRLKRLRRVRLHLSPLLHVRRVLLPARVLLPLLLPLHRSLPLSRNTMLRISLGGSSNACLAQHRDLWQGGLSEQKSSSLRYNQRVASCLAVMPVRSRTNSQTQLNSAQIRGFYVDSRNADAPGHDYQV